jgi:hypothetical protein
MKHWFAPKPRASPRWAAAGGADAPDPVPWDAFLARYRQLGADGIARVDYAAVTLEDRSVLAAWLAELQSADPSTMHPHAALSFWLNLYNAATVQLVLSNWPLRSIRDIKPGLFAFGPWSEKILTIDGIALSLNAIEHQILRPLWRDPLIHYGLNCASLGCPNLPEAAFRAETVAEDLTVAAQQFVSHPRALSQRGTKLIMSSLYAWYKPDFDAEGGVLEHLRRYASPAQRQLLGPNARIAGDDYDWRVNAVF